MNVARMYPFPERSIMQDKTIFKPEMVAPCGLDCNICSQALLDDDPCQGCNGPDDHKPEFCAKYCGIMENFTR